MRVSRDMTTGLSAELSALPQEEWPAVISARATAWGVHVSTLRRRLKEEHGFEFGDDRPGRASYVTDEDVRQIAALLLRSVRKGRTVLTIEQAIETAWANSLLRCVQQPPLATVSRRLRELHLSPAELTAPAPHVRMRSEFSNHVHQLDASLCVQYRFHRAGLQLDYFDINKLASWSEVTSAVHRWVLCDHLSGAFLVMYFDSPGERVEDMLKFLHWSWSQKVDTRIPFCGVPRMLYLDRGPAFMSQALQNLCRAYDITLRWHAPGRARATGSAESTHWRFERHFESRLRLQPIHTVDELIERATLEAVAMCTTRPHTRHKRTRFEAWREGLEGAARVPVEDFEQFCWLAHGREEVRTVAGDLTIRYTPKKGERLVIRLADARPNQEVVLRPHPFERGRVRVFAGTQELAATFVELDKWGFRSTDVPFGSHVPDMRTPAQELEATLPQLRPLENVWVTDEELAEDIYGLPPVATVSARGEQPALCTVQMLDVVEAKCWVVTRLGRALSRTDAQWWNARIGDGIASSELETALEEFTTQAARAVA